MSFPFLERDCFTNIYIYIYIHVKLEEQVISMGKEYINISLSWSNLLRIDYRYQRVTEKERQTERERKEKRCFRFVSCFISIIILSSENEEIDKTNSVYTINQYTNGYINLVFFFLLRYMNIS